MILIYEFHTFELRGEEMNAEIITIKCAIYAVPTYCPEFKNTQINYGWMLTCNQASFPSFSVSDFCTSPKKKDARSQVRLNCTHHCDTDKNPESEAHYKSIEKWQFHFRLLASHKAMTSSCVIRAQLSSFPYGTLSRDGITVNNSKLEPMILGPRLIQFLFT